MKIYHKFLLYQNKWIHPYTRIILGGVTYIAYLASILLIMGVVYEHGFTISEHEASQLQTLYRFVWGVFLSEVTLRLLLEYRDTKRTFKKLTWILIALLYLTLIPVIFHRPEEEGAILHFWEILNGKRSVSTEYALLFEAALGIDAEVWIRQQARYDMQMAKSDISFLERLAHIRKIAAVL